MLCFVSYTVYSFTFIVTAYIIPSQGIIIEIISIISMGVINVKPGGGGFDIPVKKIVKIHTPGTPPSVKKRWESNLRPLEY